MLNKILPAFLFVVACSSGGAPDHEDHPSPTIMDTTDGGIDAAPADAFVQRIIYRTDPDPEQGGSKVYDLVADAPCQKQPLCDNYCGTDWSKASFYCVPAGLWDGHYIAVTGYSDGPTANWFADPDCLNRNRVYFLRTPYWNNGDRPKWAYDFQETEPRASVWGIGPAPANTRYYKKAANGTCAPVVYADQASLLAQWAPFMVMSNWAAKDWVLWADAKKQLEQP